MCFAFPDIKEDLEQVGVYLTPDQVNAIKSILEGQDVLAVMPTGAGKSMIFQSIAHSLAKRSSNEIVLVVTPLKSISFLHIRTLERVRTFLVTVNERFKTFLKFSTKRHRIGGKRATKFVKSCKFQESLMIFLCQKCYVSNVNVMSKYLYGQPILFEYTHSNNLNTKT